MSCKEVVRMKGIPVPVRKTNVALILPGLTWTALVSSRSLGRVFNTTEDLLLFPYTNVILCKLKKIDIHGIEWIHSLVSVSIDQKIWCKISLHVHSCQIFYATILNSVFGTKSYQPILGKISAYEMISPIVKFSRVTLYTAGHLHTVVPHCSHSRAPSVHTAVPRENNEHGCVYSLCRAVCKLPGCVEGHPWF